MTSERLLTATGTKYGKGSIQPLEVVVGGLSASSTTILRTDARIDCAEGSSPTGNVLTTISDVTVGSETIAVGNQTVPLQQVGSIQTPPAAGLSLVKTQTSITPSGTHEAGDAVIRAGDVINYKIVARNTGNVALQGLTVTDFGAEMVQCGTLLPTTLLVTGTIECTASHTVTEADILGGSYTNTARANTTTGALVVESNSVTTQLAFADFAMSADTALSDDGGTITYRVRAKNTGNVSMADMEMHDLVVNGDGTHANICRVSNLNPGQSSADCEWNYTATTSDFTSHSRANTFTGQSGSLTKSMSVSTPLNIAPSLSLSVVSPANLAEAVQAGTSAAYGVTVRNNGNVSLKSLKVMVSGAEVPCAGVTDAVLLVGDAHALACTLAYDLHQQDLDAAGVTIKAVGTSVIHDVNDVQSPSLKQDLQSLIVGESIVTEANVHAGHTVEYKVTIENKGNVTVKNVSFTPEVDNTVSICARVGALTRSVPNMTAGTQELGDLAPGRSISCTVDHTLDQADVNSGSHAFHYAIEAHGQKNWHEIDTTIPASPDYEIIVTPNFAGKSLKLAGEQVPFELYLRNTGNVTLDVESITYTDSTVDEQETVVVCPQNNGSKTTIEYDKSIICSGTHVLTQTDLDEGLHTNTFIVNAQTPKAAQITRTGSLKLELNSEYGVYVSKKQTSVNPTFAGDVITYELTAINTGQKTLKDVQIVDPGSVYNAASCARNTLSSGKDFSCTSRHVVTQAELESGRYESTAYATTSSKQGRTSSNTLVAGFLTADRALQLNVNQSRRLITQSALLSTTSTIGGGSLSYFFRSNSAGCVIVGSTVIARNPGNCVVGARLSGQYNLAAVESNDVTITFTAPVIEPAIEAPAAVLSNPAPRQLLLPSSKLAAPLVAASNLGNAKVTKSTELSSQSVGGFAPGSETRMEVIGARTTGQFILTPNAASDPVALAGALQESTQRNAQDFAKVTNVQSVSAPDPSNVLSGDTSEDDRDVFSASKLDVPITVGQIPTDANTKWIKLDASVDTYKPGSKAYIVVTTQPIILGAAIVDEFGKADLTGYLPVTALPEGGHNIRVIGARSLGGVSTDANGKVTLSQQTVNAINQFDQGTNATVLVTGMGANGGTNTATLVVELDKDVPWFTLWYVIGSTLAVLLMAMLKLMRRVRARVIFSGVIVASALPAFILGWTSSSYEVMGWGAALMMMGVLQTWFLSPLFTLKQDKAARDARREARRAAHEARESEIADDLSEEEAVDHGHRLAG